jgi:hypothetical protein
MRSSRARTRFTVAIATLAAAATLVALLVAGSHQQHRRPAPVRHDAAIPTTAPTTVPSAPAPTAAASTGGGSPDSYAAYLARALWTIDYTRRSRAQEEEFWRAQLADVVPAGAPAGTTVTQAQQAALSTLDARLPTAATWATLAATHTQSRFNVTSVSEPSSWISAVAAGQITDPGLTARTVLGVQTLSYGTPAHTTRQTQSVTIVMLCQPTTSTCRLEIIPPDDGSSGP